MASLALQSTRACITSLSSLVNKYGLAIKAKHIPSPEELMPWIKPDMVHFGYTDIFEFYAIDEDEVFSRYDTENIDNWPLFGE